MGSRLLELLTTPSVEAAQLAHGSRAIYARRASTVTTGRELSEDEGAFIGARDSFYMATVSSNGWPYVQHRGGTPGFVQVLDSRTLAFADYRGNRQYLSLGNLADDERASFFFMDYPNRRRLKLLGRVAVRRVDEADELAARILPATERARVEHIFVVSVEGFDWNCPQYITPRYTETELHPLLARLEALEQENRRLQALVDHDRVRTWG